MRMMLSDPTGQIERECAMPEMKQRDVASTYGLAVRDEADVPVDWKRANAAIVRRWPKGLARVKKMAWDLLNARTSAVPTGDEPLRPGDTEGQQMCDHPQLQHLLDYEHTPE